ncbi:hypothetical protein ACFVQB_18715 [Paenibacillus sp. NPDC057886]|uniref:hypothetical protein n=1 Tax=Paenibacillus sp. NPDC057886 TaxID=3346270 RepID=UPI0036B694CA
MNRSFKSITLRISKASCFIFAKQSGAENTYTAEPSTTTIIDGKYQLTTHIQYGEKYPRSFLDIITPDGQFDEEHAIYAAKWKTVRD